MLLYHEIFMNHKCYSKENATSMIQKLVQIFNNILFAFFSLTLPPCCFSSCQINCLPNHEFPAGQTSTTMTCTDGEWTYEKEIKDCRRKKNFRNFIFGHFFLLKINFIVCFFVLQRFVIRLVRMGVTASPSTSANVLRISRESNVNSVSHTFNFK